MATLRDVAKRAGVSISTVSHVIYGRDDIPESTAKRVRKAIEAFRAPVIVIDKRWNSNRIRFVSSENHDGGRLSGHHLLQGGCKRIAFVGAEHDHTSHERQRGFEAALAEADVNLAPEFKANAHWHFEMSYQAAANWFSLSPGARPDGVFCASDTMALAVINAALDKGLAIPEDVSIVGFDDIPLAHQVRPKLTTIRQDPHRIGRRAVEMLFAMIGGGMVEDDYIPVELIVRESSRRS